MLRGDDVLLLTKRVRRILVRGRVGEFKFKMMMLMTVYTVIYNVQFSYCKTKLCTREMWDCLAVLGLLSFGKVNLKTPPPPLLLLPASRMNNKTGQVRAGEKNFPHCQKNWASLASVSDIFIRRVYLIQLSFWSIILKKERKGGLFFPDWLWQK